MKRKWEDKKRLSRKMFKVGQSEKQGDKDTFSKKTGTKEKAPRMMLLMVREWEEGTVSWHYFP